MSGSMEIEEWDRRYVCREICPILDSEVNGSENGRKMGDGVTYLWDMKRLEILKKL